MSFVRATPYRWVVGLGFGIVVGCGSVDASPPGNSADGRGGASGAGDGLPVDGGGRSGAGGGTAGTKGGGTGGQSTIGTVVGDDSGASSVNPDAACVAAAREGEQRPVALLFMVDNSQSMATTDPGQTATRWQLVLQAVPAFIADPGNAGLWAALDFFPEPGMPVADAGRGGNNGNNNNVSCVVADYENLNVPFGVLPGTGNAQATAITTALNNRAFGNNTPTTPALQGALASATTWQLAHPEQRVAVVFVTDGQPNGCGSSVQTAAATAAASLAATPPIATYVLGVGVEVGNLEAIATSGGTGMPYIVTSGGAAALTAALNAIKGTAVSCDYTIPSTGTMLDYAAVNVQTRVGVNGQSSLLLQVADAAACAGGDGWYYDVAVTTGGPAPSSIFLCPASCDPLKNTPNSKIDVLIGCKTQSRIQ